MKTGKFTVEQTAHALRRVESGAAVAEVCRELGITETTFYRWKRKYHGLGTPELRELRQLREENKKLKQVVADLALGRTMLQEALRNKWEGRPGAGGWWRGDRSTTTRAGAGRVGRSGSPSRACAIGAYGRTRNRCGGGSARSRACG
jgi:putative transposase